MDPTERDQREAIINISPVLLAIIDNHPSEVGRVARLERTLDSLFGLGLKRGRKDGSQLEQDERDVARAYFLNYLGFAQEKQKLGSLCREVVLRDRAVADFDEEEIRQRIQTLRRRFMRNKDRLLIQIAAELTAEGRQKILEQGAVLKALQRIGVRID